jgi:hypothetical protein
MLQTSRSSISIGLGLAAGCAAALALPGSAPAGPNAPPQRDDAGLADVAALRAQGPAALDGMLARWDRMAPGPDRDRLALTIDSVAGQRYATMSRLYWYTDLTAAQQAARTLDRPILALRMLGRLDEDLSCANSRFFRTTLYANAEVSKLMRDNFVLYWSSERPVPRVTIDYGDGRRLERTTTGNSAHYVLDAAGRVLDVLPGLYAPAVFRAELTKSAQLAQRVRRLGEGERARAVADHHRRERDAANQRFTSVAGLAFTRTRRLLAKDEMGDSAVARAQRTTMAKARVEVPELGKIGIDAGSVPTSDTAAWATIGQKVWGIFAAKGPAVLDARTRGFVAHVHNAGPVKASQAELDAMLARLEQSIVADTAINDLILRTRIRNMLAVAELRGFEQLNAWIYSSVFQTPKSDAWLGLLPRTDFTGLPGDGVVMP